MNKNIFLDSHELGSQRGDLQSTRPAAEAGSFPTELRHG
jgi:hypothetical protein